MPYRIEFTPTAARTLRKLDRPTLERIVPKIDALAGNPRPHGVEKLAGRENRYRLRVGDHRVVFAIQDSARLVTVAIIAHRSEVYR